VPGVNKYGKVSTISHQVGITGVMLDQATAEDDLATNGKKDTCIVRINSQMALQQLLVSFGRKRTYNGS
jgi:hypothetical protein